MRLSQKVIRLASRRPAGARELGAMLAAIAILFSSCSKAPEHKAASLDSLLEDLARSRNDQVRAAAAEQLGVMKDTKAVAPLIAALKDRAPSVRMAAVAALGEIKDPAAVEPLCALLRKDHREIKVEAARALAKLRDERAAQPLVAALRDIETEARSALLTLDDLAVPALVAGLHDVETRVPASQALAMIGSPAVDALKRTVSNDPNESARLAAIGALTEINDKQAAEALDAALSNPTHEQASVAYRFLIRRGRAGSEALLIDTLRGYGTPRMAADFVYSGNPALEAAGRAWAKKNRVALPAVTEAAPVWQKQIPPTQLLLFHYDDGLAATSGIAPAKMVGTSHMPGKWGSAVAVAPDGLLSYPLAGNLNFDTGTIEMWISPRFPGTDATYGRFNHALLLYVAPDGDQFIVSANTSRTFYAGSVVRKTFYGAGGGDFSRWKPGEWHHIAFTYSAKGNKRLFVDGVLVNGNSAAMPAPALGEAVFTVNSDPWGHGSAFLVDELRISSDEKSPSTIEYDAGRARPFTDFEVHGSLNALNR
jgi:HEAT repeat protein